MTLTADTPTAPTTARFTHDIDRELLTLPEEIDRVIGHETGPLGGVSRYLFAPKGKLIRPALLFASAAAGVRGRDAWTMQTRRLAASVEILHVATLYHDDVIDSADTRRGLTSSNVEFGPTMSVLAGDFLITKSIAIANDAGSRFAGRVLDALKDLCTGQAIELADIGNIDRTLEDYEACITAKTGSLFALACEFGGASGSLVDSDVENLRAYGNHLGIAFQIADDLHDLLSAATTVGKPVLNDMAERNHTMPTILALQKDPGLRDLLDHVHDDAQLRPQVVDRIIAAGGVARTREAINDHVARALASLPTGADPSPEAAFLQALPQRVVGAILNTAPEEK